MNLFLDSSVLLAACGKNRLELIHAILKRAGEIWNDHAWEFFSKLPRLAALAGSFESV